jgi:hypothetical protein
VVGAVLVIRGRESREGQESQESRNGPDTGANSPGQLTN